MAAKRSSVPLAASARPWRATGTDNRIIQNIIYSNNGLGVDIGMNGPTPNDPGDTDVGFNNVQNAPIITLASSDHNATRSWGH